MATINDSLHIPSSLISLSSSNYHHHSTQPKPAAGSPLPPVAIACIPFFSSSSLLGSSPSRRFTTRAAVDGQYSSRWSGSNEPRVTIMLPECDYNHWLIVMEFPKDLPLPGSKWSLPISTPFPLFLEGVFFFFLGFACACLPAYLLSLNYFLWCLIALFIICLIDVVYVSSQDACFDTVQFMHWLCCQLLLLT